MPLASDTTALIALSAAGLMPLLPQHFGDVHIGATVRAEARTAAADLTAGIAAGWLHVHRGSPPPVAALARRARLHAGEAETIVLAGQLPGAVTLLVDERRAFNLIAMAYPQFGLITLGHVLTAFEDAGDIPSAAAVLATLRAAGTYAMAPSVSRAYQRWRASRAKTPQP